MIGMEQKELFESKKLFLGSIGYNETTHLMKMKDKTRAETCISIKDGETVWTLDEFEGIELIKFIDGIDCYKCKKELKCPICGYKGSHRKETIDDEILQVRMGISRCNNRLNSNLDAYYDVVGTLNGLEKILKHLEIVKSKI